MGLLVRRAPELHPGACDMIVDMDRLDALTLRQLQVGRAPGLSVASCCGMVHVAKRSYGLPACPILLLLLQW